MLDFLTLLRENPYPGRGILVSRDLVYYFIMGRSANSRNRIFVKTEDGIRTEPHHLSSRPDHGRRAGGHQRRPDGHHLPAR